jgi:diacylglycerol kinase family enzyme
VALVAALGVVVSLAVLVVRNVPALLAALGALLIAGAVGWVAVTRQGAVRLLAAVGAAAVLIAGAVALIVLGALNELVVLVLAAGFFAAASRIAFRRTAAQGAAAAAKPRSGARPRRAILLMNPRSGGGKVERFDLVGEARRRRIEPVVLEPGDDLRALAHDAAKSADVIGMAGGDGSQALVAQVAMEHDLPYVCIPAGTRNHLALDLGLDRDDVVGALDAFVDGWERRIDLAFVNERIFVNNVSLGIYAEIVRSDAYRDAKLETVQTMLPTLLGPGATPFDVRFRGPDGREQETAQLILISNNPYLLDRLGGLGSRPRVDSGQLGIVAVAIANAAQAAELVSLSALGQVSRFEGWREWTAPEFEVASSGPLATGIDGEAVVLDPPLRFTVAPGALTVLLPPAATGLSPAALQPGFSSATLRELWQLARAPGDPDGGRS